jgi:hypothetical protein
MDSIQEFDNHNHPAKAGSLEVYRLSTRAGWVTIAEGGGRARTAKKVEEE